MDIPQQICDLITLVYDKETDKIFIIPTANDKPVKIVYERFDWETKVDSNNITFSKIIFLILAPSNSLKKGFLKLVILCPLPFNVPLNFSLIAVRAAPETNEAS